MREEEFAVVMIIASKEEAHPILERLRANVEDQPFRNREIQPGGWLTVGAGLAAFSEDGPTYDELLGSADEALYRGKNSGRNQVRLAGATKNQSGEAG